LSNLIEEDGYQLGKDDKEAGKSEPEGPQYEFQEYGSFS
jgi:hypothetical protein